MKDYNSLIYDDQRHWILKARNNGKTWEEIEFAMQGSEDGLVSFLNERNVFDFWKVDAEDWHNIVKIEKDGEQNRINIDFSRKSAVIGKDDDNNELKAPTTEYSNWQKYRLFLLNEQKFLKQDVDAIEHSAERILKHLSLDTKGKARKGLVIGNVQSGKTANMCGLMSMAADNGWNMFIVLSGTIENLRKQTANRMVSDLSISGCSFNWRAIDRPSKKSPIGDRVQDLDFSKDSHQRYLVVSLKNSTRLKDIIQWLHTDSKVRQMNVLIIDDESDQASINTKKDETERTRINSLLVNLVGNRDEKGNKTNNQFKAMNYIGYTATPYANVLNEAGEESLYPHDFVATLEVSKTYFGPQHYFGDRISNVYPGLDVVRGISKEDVDEIKDIHDGFGSLPPSMEDALCWFLCSAACFRVWNYKKPVSMLVHTSQKIKHHSTVYDAIETWFATKDEISILKKCYEIWSTETELYSVDELFEGYPDFATSRELIHEYPDFDKLIPYIKELVSQRQPVILGDEGDFEYGRGIHICVDNCKNNRVAPDGTYMRLTYPEKGKEPNFSTAFIVIGGATLSRGLTIEGLVSTYFLRATTMADTLMQMGRWFGYRRGYELLPRLWLTDNAYNQFVFLSDLDGDLREKISEMEVFNKKPHEYAVVVKNTPSVKFIRITAKNKMKAAKLAEMNYSGTRKQTTLLLEQDSILKQNYKVAEEFLNSLGKPMHCSGEIAEGSYFWEGIPFTTIYDNLFSKFQFHPRGAFADVDAIKDWVQKATSKGALTNWNVAIIGLSTDKKDVAKFKYFEVTKITRTRRNLQENTINLGVLTDPKEKLIDVDPKYLGNVKKSKGDYKVDDIDFIRKEAGLDKTPLLTIYIVDKNSKADKKRSMDRYDLNTLTDVVGLSINIPGDRINSKFAESIAIDLSKYNFESDIKGDAEIED